MTDNIFNRLHSLKRPGVDEPQPILIGENPSRDFYFPISGPEALDVLKVHSTIELGGLTHIWLRRDKRSADPGSNAPQAEFVCGSGVRVIILYPCRRDGLFPLGSSKPTSKAIRPFQALGAEFREVDGHWYAHLDPGQARQYYVQHLLLHEFAHHLDWFCRHWSKANHKKVEDFANQYAVRWGADAVEILNNLDSNGPT